MSGHSKWSTIKRAKGAADSKRAVVFGKLSKKISVAAREGNSGDPAHNFRLRVEVDKAKAIQMFQQLEKDSKK
jgi:transcriptional/translational regulatory protein YebC/TACO1